MAEESKKTDYRDLLKLPVGALEKLIQEEIAKGESRFIPGIGWVNERGEIVRNENRRTP